MKARARETPDRESNLPLAVVAGVLCPGLGHLYVGRLRLALIAFPAIFGTIAVAGWSRLVLQPVGTYICYSIVLIGWLFFILHPAVIAFKQATLPSKAFNRWWVYVLLIVAYQIVGSYIVANRASLFGYESFRIPARSMAPTVNRGDFIMVNTWSYNDATPVVNDLVVFETSDVSGVKFVKRVVGISGDIIEIRDSVLFRNGAPVAENFILIDGVANGRKGSFGPINVPEQHFFVLGDNRLNSKDSRWIGPIHEDLLIGRVEHRWFAYDDGINWSRFPAKLTAVVDSE